MTMPSFDNLSRGDKVSAYTGTVEQIEKALEAVGVEYLENDGAACGVRFRRRRCGLQAWTAQEAQCRLTVRCDMPFFMVRCYVAGKSDENPQKVEANDKLEAAEKICGGPLKEWGKLGNLRAVVWPLDNPNGTTSFRGRDQ